MALLPPHRNLFQPNGKRTIMAERSSQVCSTKFEFRQCPKMCLKRCVLYSWPADVDLFFRYVENPSTSTSIGREISILVNRNLAEHSYLCDQPNVCCVRNLEWNFQSPVCWFLIYVTIVKNQSVGTQRN